MSALNRIIGGVDDAGRGAILGPLVIAGVSMQPEGLKRIVEIGVRDSKTLSPAGRRRLYAEIKPIAHKTVSVSISPEEVDSYVMRKKKFEKLNLLEATTMGRVVGELDAEVVYVDASDTDPQRFKRNILSDLKTKVEVIAEHHADRLYPIVSAASIIAKVDRDSEIERLKGRYGDFGSGYPSDQRTREFLRGWLEANGTYPPFSRRSWKTWKRLHSADIGSFY